MKRKLLKIADQIFTLEEKINKGENVSESMETIEDLTKELTVEEMVEIDEYLANKLTK